MNIFLSAAVDYRYEILLFSQNYLSSKRDPKCYSGNINFNFWSLILRVYIKFIQGVTFVWESIIFLLLG